MELITKTDAIQTVHKALLELMDTLPTKDMDGDRVFEDQEKAFLLFTANKMVCKALKALPSWHTDDPEEQMEYLVTLSVKQRNGKTYKFLAISEWVPPLINDEGDIIEDGEWGFESWMRESYDDVSVLAWMPLPDKYEEEV